MVTHSRDLVVDVTAGQLRRLKIQQQRLSKAKLRVNRIRRLAKINRATKKLWSTGAKPQCT